MFNCFFVSDLHGSITRYNKLFHEIEKDKPDVVFFGGDLLPHPFKKLEKINDFVTDFLFLKLYQLKELLKEQYPKIILIFGNDDARSEEIKFIEESKSGLFFYANQQKTVVIGHDVYGYSFVPPTPFQMKDWERYDVSRYVDPGCIHPLEGFRTTATNEDIEYATIKKDLEKLTGNEDVSDAVLLFHSPPYKTNLDRAALDGKMIDHVPMDVHVGSIAIQRYIEERQPLLTLHGHIHESTRLTGNWEHMIGKTFCFNAAHDGPELAVIKFGLDSLDKAKRILI